MNMDHAGTQVKKNKNPQVPQSWQKKFHPPRKMLRQDPREPLFGSLAARFPAPESTKGSPKAALASCFCRRVARF
ncbi:hypothetical protein [Paraburkholderia sp. JHI869]|uniref:hypothetical protein n=1 Tax=Paraburkholderia sp. JHI869 TaxID=3112959 RepID=UPI003176F5F8